VWQPDLSAGLCRQVGPGHWFTLNQAKIHQAIDMCYDCPVMVQCGDYADWLVANDREHELSGIWGGRLYLDSLDVKKIELMDQRTERVKASMPTKKFDYTPAIMAVSCPTCGAKSLERCRPRGQVYSGVYPPHIRRVERAGRLGNGMDGIGPNTGDGKPGDEVRGDDREDVA